MIMEAGLTTLRIMQQAGRNRLVVLGHQGLHAEDNDTRFELVGKYRLGRLVDVAHVMNRDQDQDGEPERHSHGLPEQASTNFHTIEHETLPRSAGSRCIIDQFHVGAGHQALDIGHDHHPPDRRQAEDVAGIETAREIGRRTNLRPVNEITSETLSTTVPITRPATFRMMTTVNGVYSILPRLNLMRRSTIGTIVPRKLITP
jgi:hypothetical protein